MVGIGEPAKIARRYNQLNSAEPCSSARRPIAGARAAAADSAEIVDAWFEDVTGNRIAELANAESCCVAVEVRFNETTVDPIFGVTLRNDVGMTVFATTTAYGMGPTGEFYAGRHVVIRLRFDNWLATAATP